MNIFCGWLVGHEWWGTNDENHDRLCYRCGRYEIFIDKRWDTPNGHKAREARKQEIGWLLEEAREREKGKVG